MFIMVVMVVRAPMWGGFTGPNYLLSKDCNDKALFDCLQ
jgi:hypothetical protein